MNPIPTRHRGLCAALSIGPDIAPLQAGGVRSNVPNCMRRAAAQGHEKAQLVLRLWDAVTDESAATTPASP